MFLLSKLLSFLLLNPSIHLTLHFLVLAFMNVACHCFLDDDVS
nr:MAG TPA: hypothetical protein [Caudoviricetes sp.]